jgi:hypothetical protein
MQDVSIIVEINVHFEMNGANQQIMFNKSKLLVLRHKVK